MVENEIRKTMYLMDYLCEYARVKLSMEEVLANMREDMDQDSCGPSIIKFDREDVSMEPARCSGEILVLVERRLYVIQDNVV
jgi:hypothetical protein